MRRKIFFFLILIVNLSASDEVMIFENIGEAQGLGFTQIETIYQQSQGYIWIGGFQLSRFDGYSCQNFEYLPNDSTTVSGNLFTDIKEDSSQRLWIATNDGLCLYCSEKENFKRYPLVQSQKSNQSSQHIYCLEVDHFGGLWLGTDRGVQKYNDSLDQIAITTFFNQDSQIKVNDQINHILKFENKLYAVGNTNKLFMIDPLSHEIEIIVSKNINLGNVIDCITHDGQIYLMNSIGMIVVYDPKTKNFTRLDIHYPGIEPSRQIFKKACFIFDQLWIASNVGLFIYNPGTQITKHFYTNNRVVSGFETNNFTYVFWDKDQSVWLGSIDMGVLVWHKKKYKFNIFNHFPQHWKIFEKNSIHGICQDQNQTLWIASHAFGLLSYDFKNDLLKSYSAPLNELNKEAPNHSELSVAIHDHKIYTGHWAKGITVFDPKTNHFSYIRHDPQNRNSLGSDNVWYLNFDSGGNLWVSTLDGGLTQCDLNNNEFIRYSPDEPSSHRISDDYVFCSYEDSQGNILIGTAGNGLDSIDHQTKEIKNYSPDHNDQYSISNRLVWAIFEDSKNRIWVGSSIGLNLFDPQEGTFKKYYKSDGLVNNDVRTILEDQNGLLWIGTANGLSSFDVEKEEFVNYYKSDGLVSNEFLQNSGFVTDSGRLFMGGRKGMIYFYPDSIKKNSIKPQIVFSDLLIYNQKVGIGDTVHGRVILEKSLAKTDELRLTHKEDFFSIGFSSIQYIAPEKSRFAYMLEGYDDHWIFTDAQKRFASFTNLNPGKYSLHVKASNNNGLWSKVKSIEIVILPPWWESWWFRIIMIVSIILSVSLIILLRFNRLKRQQRFLENEIRIHTKNLREQAQSLSQKNIELMAKQQLIEEQSDELRAQKEELLKNNIILQQNNEELHQLNEIKNKLVSIIAHDLRNPFSPLIGLLDLLTIKFTKFSDEEKLRLINNARTASKNIYALLENLLEWVKAHSNSIKFRPDFLDVYSLVQSQFCLVQKQAEHKNIKLINRLSQNDVVFADLDMLKTIIRNLLFNAIKYTENGSVSILGKFGKDCSIISISDTGVGIEQEKIESLFEIQKDKSTLGTSGEKGSGLGLCICKDLIHYHRGTIEVHSEVGNGTVFSLHLPNPLNH